MKRIDGKKVNEDVVVCEKLLFNGQSEFAEAITKFRKVLAKIPIGAEIENWLHNLDLPKKYLDEYRKNIIAAIDNGVLRIVDEKGKVHTLNDLSAEEHMKVIHEIRCIPNQTIAQKESMVESYILFTQHLSRQTHGLIMQGEDPDFHRTLTKVVWHKDFIAFVQHLPERDALIAKLLYFGAPTMDEVLNLRVKQVDLKESRVKFQKFSVSYPKHIILDLQSYLSGKAKKALVFVNLRGEQVERTHLNNCFNRASRKHPNGKRITPKMLLESDVAKGVSDEPLFKKRLL